MNCIPIDKLPNCKLIKEKYMINDKAKFIKEEKEKELVDILIGKSNKFLIIVGPCSIDSEEAIIEYAKQMYKIQNEVKDKILILIRAYTSKPRTLLNEYKGIIHQPNLFDDENIILGIEKAREIHTKIINETNMIIADELLYPELYSYIEDTVSYMTIGARSSNNQQHKLIASALNIPVGIKNTMNGNIQSCIKNVLSAKLSNHCIYDGFEVKTKGNDLAHIILRGYQDKYSNNYKNYKYSYIKKLLNKEKELHCETIPIIIDCNHSNSNKNYKKQIKNVKYIIKYINKKSEFKNNIKGIMIESYLKNGKQKISNKMNYGQSITDECINIVETRNIINFISSNL